MKAMKNVFLGLVIAASFSIIHLVIGELQAGPVAVCDDDGGCKDSGFDASCTKPAGTALKCTCKEKPPAAGEVGPPKLYYCHTFT